MWVQLAVVPEFFLFPDSRILFFGPFSVESVVDGVFVAVQKFDAMFGWFDTLQVNVRYRLRFQQ